MVIKAVANLGSVAGGTRVRPDPTAAVAGWITVSNLYATLHTNRGDIKIELLPNHAPKTVNNFVGLAKGTAKYTTKNASGETTGPVLRRRDLPPGDLRVHDPGRRPDRHRPRRPRLHLRRRVPPGTGVQQAVPAGHGERRPGTNGSQFFITVGPQPHLNLKHTIFGEVADQASRDVVDGIDSHRDRPFRSPVR